MYEKLSMICLLVMCTTNYFTSLLLNFLEEHPILIFENLEIF